MFLTENPHRQGEAGAADKDRQTGVVVSGPAGGAAWQEGRKPTAGVLRG